MAGPSRYHRPSKQAPRFRPCFHAKCRRCRIQTRRAVLARPAKRVRSVIALRTRHRRSRRHPSFCRRSSGSAAAFVACDPGRLKPYYVVISFSRLSVGDDAEARRDYESRRSHSLGEARVAAPPATVASVNPTLFHSFACGATFDVCLGVDARIEICSARTLAEPLTGQGPCSHEALAIVQFVALRGFRSGALSRLCGNLGAVRRALRSSALQRARPCLHRSHKRSHCVETLARKAAREIGHQFALIAGVPT